MKKGIFIKLKNSMYKISPKGQKIIGTMATIPLIATSSMQGACAGGGCPYGLVNDLFPGNCSRYIDLNGDGICDLSQSVASTSTSDTTSSSSGSDSSTSSQDVDTSVNGAQGSHNTDPSNASIVHDSGTLDNNSTQIDPNNYHMLPITLLLVGGYLITYYLFSKGILKQHQHKRIWNLLLVGGYFGTGVTGILITFMVNLGISTIYNPGITYWHAELAILMVVGTMIHLHIYRKLFKRIFKVLFEFISKNNIESMDKSK